jgi:hypothetical protein
MMNGRMPISPLARILESRTNAHSAGEPRSDWTMAKWEDARFFRSSFIYDFESEANRRLNWGALFGLALSVGLSASFWSVAVLLFVRLSK